MSKKANPVTLGIFMVAGLALAIAGVLLFTSSKLFANTEKYVLYFDASVKGLNPGAPVKFRGVTVGSVTEVMIRLNQAEGDLTVPVIIEIDQNQLRQKSDRTIQLQDPAAFASMVDQGLRATLQAQSFVTGLLYVELEILPEAGPPVFHQVKKIHPEIPTVPTQITELMRNLAQVDVSAMADKLNSILNKLDDSLDALQLQQINHGLTNVLASLNHLVQSPELTNALAALNGALQEFRSLTQEIRHRVPPLADGADQTLAQARRTLSDLQRTVQDVRDLISPQAPLRRDVLQAVEELGQAAKSIADLADYLSRNPRAILSGRTRPEPKK
jgi:phospholipid/cholesterol/gamma-HCH transport system substrate-binding protein